MHNGSTPPPPKATRYSIFNLITFALSVIRSNYGLNIIQLISSRSMETAYKYKIFILIIFACIFLASKSSAGPSKEISATTQRQDSIAAVASKGDLSSPNDRIKRASFKTHGLTFHIWDFGGQCIYYITHPVSVKCHLTCFFVLVKAIV